LPAICRSRQHNQTVEPVAQADRAVCQVGTGCRVCDCCAADRRQAGLLRPSARINSGMRWTPISLCRKRRGLACQRSAGNRQHYQTAEPVAQADRAVCQVGAGCRVCDCCAADRRQAGPLRPSARIKDGMRWAPICFCRRRRSLDCQRSVGAGSITRRRNRWHRQIARCVR